MIPAEQAAQALSSVTFDDGDLIATLDRLRIATALPEETQRWIAARSMVAMSLAASVADERSYYQALKALGDPPASGPERDFSRAFIAGVLEDMKVELFAEAPELFEQLQERMQDVDSLLGLLH